MSTSDLPEGVTELIPLAASGGLPSAAAIAQLANDFFKDTPADGREIAPVMADLRGISLPTEEQLRSLPATLGSSEQAAK
jgi:hypothetical protein